MPELESLETKALDRAIDETAVVRLIFVTGYQCEALILDYDADVIVAKVKGRRWLIYRSALSTIVLD